MSPSVRVPRTCNDRYCNNKGSVAYYAAPPAMVVGKFVRCEEHDYRTRNEQPDHVYKLGEVMDD